MADHPAIVALATELWRTSCADVLNRRMVNMGEWDEQSPDVQSGFLSLARSAYAAVLKDLKRMAIEGEHHKSGLIVYPPPGTERWLDERAREIGVEI